MVKENQISTNKVQKKDQKFGTNKVQKKGKKSGTNKVQNKEMKFSTNVVQWKENNISTNTMHKKTKKGKKQVSANNNFSTAKVKSHVWVGDTFKSLQHENVADIIKKNISTWMKHISQEIKTNPADKKLYICLLTQLIKTASLHLKSLPKIEHLPPVIKTLIPMVNPKFKDHHWTLCFFNTILKCQSSVLLSVKDELKRHLKLWLSHRPSQDMSSVKLAGVAWALLPIQKQFQTENHENDSEHVDTSVPKIQGQKLFQLVVTLSKLLDDMLPPVLQSQNCRIPDFLREVEKLCFTCTSDTCQCNDNSNQTNGMTDVVKKMELQVYRCINLLTFMEMAIFSVKQYLVNGSVVSPSVYLLPILKILQVSTEELSQHKVAEMKTLTSLWPSIQQRALLTLRGAISNLGATILTCPLLQGQLMRAALSLVKPDNDDAREQRTLYLLYECLAAIVKISKGRLVISLEFAKRLISDISVRKDIIKLNFDGSDKVYAKSNFKKKGNQKNHVTLTAEQKNLNKKPLCVKTSALIVQSALDLLSSIYQYVHPHMIGLDVAVYLQESLLPLARRYCEEFGSTESSSLESESGLVNLACILQDQYLFAMFLRILSMAAQNPNPLWPTPCAEVLNLLELASQRHHSQVEIISVCSQGMGSIRLFLCNPRFSTFQQQVEDHRALLSKIFTDESIDEAYTEDDTTDESIEKVQQNVTREIQLEQSSENPTDESDTESTDQEDAADVNELEESLVEDDSDSDLSLEANGTDENDLDEPADETPGESDSESVEEDDSNEINLKLSPEKDHSDDLSRPNKRQKVEADQNYQKSVEEMLAELDDL